MEEGYLSALDEHFCAHYSDYSRLSAIPGYKMPDLIEIGKDGNVYRRESELMRLKYQENCAELLKKFKEGLVDTAFSFDFSFPTFLERFKDKFDKQTFAKYLPVVLQHSGDTVENVGEHLCLHSKIWQGIVNGKLYAEKNTVLAIALVARLSVTDANNLLAVAGFSFEQDNVRDVVVDYLLSHKVFNEDMRNACLAEYKIKSLPFRRGI